MSRLSAIEEKMRQYLRSIEDSEEVLDAYESDEEKGAAPAVQNHSLPSDIEERLAAMERDEESSTKEEPTRLPDKDTTQRIWPQQDPLYDEHRDEKDEEWVQKLRERDTGGIRATHSSDAVLNCPCCFAILCLDCQRHETFQNQYRAAFARNVTVNRTEILRYSEGEVYFPVKCTHCDYDVAVMDKEGIYHFFNVFPSQA